jgi:hypothetical protein
MQGRVAEMAANVMFTISKTSNSATSLQNPAGVYATYDKGRMQTLPLYKH